MARGGESTAPAERTVELDLSIQGMNCSACAVRIERAIGKLDGVTEAAVSFPLRTAWVQLVPERVTGEQIASKIKQLGFAASGQQSAGDSLASERRRLKLRLVLSCLLTIPLLAGMGQHWPLLEPLLAWLPGWLTNPWLQLALASVIQWFIGMPFYFGAYYAIRQRSANMDVLVALGTTSAYLYSHYAVFSGGLAHADRLMGVGGIPLYFETSAVVITAVLLGKYIETSASLRARQESDGFGQLQATSAKVERDGVIADIRTEYVREKDIVVVEPGELIPIDGIVIDGESSVDEALLTGESRPAAKQAGDKAWAGTRNVYRTLRIETSAAGHSTMLSQIRLLVKQGQRSKSTLQRQVDTVASWFVPMMLLIAAATLLLWVTLLEPGNVGRGVGCAIAVLLAACPCALGLAAPISLLVASGRLARRGIIAKEAGALERLASVDTFVFDKTGTLTEGAPRIIHAAPYGIGRTALFKMAAAVEAESAHPLAQAIKAEAERLGIAATPAEQTAYLPGYGANGLVHGRSVAVGNAKYMERLKVEIERDGKAVAADRERAGETVLYVALEDRLVGLISFADRLKPSAGKLIGAMKRLGVKPIMATGDHAAPAKLAATALGIRELHASMLPEHKLRLVESLKQDGKRVAMAGDGWNDAPALAAADVGFAMGSGTEAALGAGHLTLLYPGLSGIAEAVRISRLTVRNIRQNLLFAFIYNAIIIPFAALGWLQPWMAGTAMALSSVSVVGNALRLKSRLQRASDQGVS